MEERGEFVFEVRDDDVEEEAELVEIVVDES